MALKLKMEKDLIQPSKMKEWTKEAAEQLKGSKLKGVLEKKGWATSGSKPVKIKKIFDKTLEELSQEQSSQSEASKRKAKGKATPTLPTA